MSDPVELEPVDLLQCQCEVDTYNAFVMGGPCQQRIRCFDEPDVVVSESEPDDSDQQGAMSLCTKHLVVFVSDKSNDLMKFKIQTLSDWSLDQELEKMGI